MRPIDAILDNYHNAKQAAASDRERLSIARRWLRDAQQGMFVVRGRTDDELGAPLYPHLDHQTAIQEDDDGSVQHVYLSRWGSIDAKSLNEELVTFFQADVEYLREEDDSLRTQLGNVRQAKCEPPSAKMRRNGVMQDEMPEEWFRGLMRQLVLNGYVTANSANKVGEIFQGHFSDAGKECQGPGIEWSGTVAAYRELYNGLEQLHKAGKITVKNSVGMFWEAHFDQLTDGKIHPAKHRDVSNNRSFATDSDREAIDTIIGNLTRKLFKNLKA